MSERKISFSATDDGETFEIFTHSRTHTLDSPNSFVFFFSFLFFSFHFVLTTGETWVDDASVGQSIVTMNNYGDCFLALLQISVDNNWQDILWANTIEAQHMSYLQRGFVGLYFCSFFVFMGWFGLNILTALVIETYDVAKSKGGGGGGEEGRGERGEVDGGAEKERGVGVADGRAVADGKTTGHHANHIAAAGQRGGGRQFPPHGEYGRYGAGSESGGAYYPPSGQHSISSSNNRTTFQGGFDGGGRGVGGGGGRNYSLGLAAAAASDAAAVVPRLGERLGLGGGGIEGDDDAEGLQAGWSEFQVGILS